MIHKTWLIAFFIFTLLLLFFPPSFINQVFTQQTSPTIGGFQTPEVVYANIYFTLNLTINDFNGLENLVNATVEISNSVRLKWDFANGFSLHLDPNDYCTLDLLRSSSIAINTTAYKLIFCVKLDWKYPGEDVKLIPSGTKVYNRDGADGSPSAIRLFHFNNKLVVSLKNINGTRVDANSNITITGTLWYEDTDIPPSSGNSALRLEGRSYINCGNASSLFWQDSGSIAFWAKIKPLGVWQHAFDKTGRGVSEPNQGYSITISHDNAIRLSVRTDVDVYSTSGYFLNGDWHHIVGTWGNNELRLYIDGVRYGETVSTKGIISVGENYPLYIGARQPDYGFTSGIIDEVRVYNRTLLTREVWEHYQGVYSNQTGLVLHLFLDGDVRDKSGSDSQFVLSGSTYSWTDGYVNVPLVFELNEIIEKVVSLVNSTTGLFLFSLESGNLVGQYYYSLYPQPVLGEVGKGQTFNIVVDRLKIVEGGITDSLTEVGETQIIWFKAVYESNDSEFTGDSGALFVNGKIMDWSETNGRWEFVLNPIETGNVTFRLTGFIDRNYGLTNMYDAVGYQTLRVNERINPVTWLNMFFLAIMAIIFFISSFRSKKSLSSEDEKVEV